MKKQFIYIGVIVFFVLLVGYSVFSFFNTDESSENERPIPKTLKVIKNHVPQIKNTQEKAIEISVDDIFQVEEIAEVVEEKVVLSNEQKELELKIRIQEQLETRVHFIYRQCKELNKKKSILKKFNTMQYEDVFLADMKGNTLYGSNDVEDINARTIVLEQIQRVGKYGEGFIVSDVDYSGKKRYMYVKSLDLENLYIGADFYVSSL